VRPWSMRGCCACVCVGGGGRIVCVEREGAGQGREGCLKKVRTVGAAQLAQGRKYTSSESCPVFRHSVFHGFETPYSNTQEDTPPHVSVAHRAKTPSVRTAIPGGCSGRRGYAGRGCVDRAIRALPEHGGIPK
jgi:hypothetical protein